MKTLPHRVHLSDKRCRLLMSVIKSRIFFKITFLIFIFLSKKVDIVVIANDLNFY